MSNFVKFHGDNIIVDGRTCTRVMSRRDLATEVEAMVDALDFKRIDFVLDEFGGNADSATEVACRVGKIYWSAAYRARVAQVFKEAEMRRLAQREGKWWKRGARDAEPKRAPVLRK